MPQAAARNSSLAIVTEVANRFGMDGWELMDAVNQPHSSYRLSLELAYLMEDDEDQQPAPVPEVIAPEVE